MAKHMWKLSGVLLVLALAGCNYTYRATTVLHADGSVDREIYQPAGQGADEGPMAAGWAKVVREKPAAAAGGGAVAAGAGGAGGDPAVAIARATASLDALGRNTQYFTASGHFASPDRIPEHFVTGWQGEKLALPPDLPPGRLVRRSGRADFVFVTRHDWVETLTDAVTYEGARKAREELADLAGAFCRDVADEALGKQYDAAGLEQWARTEGKAWLVELTDFALVQIMVIKQRPPVAGDGEPVAELIDGLAGICARHGLKVKRDGRILKDTELKLAVTDFLIDLACRTVRTRADGKPVDRAAARWWVESLVGGDRKPGDPAPEPNPFEAAVERVLTAKYGGPDAMKKRLAPLVIRVAGWYWPDFMSRRNFEYSMTVPGEVVWTNGELLGANRVRWEFEARLAYPFGYDMACQSIEPHLDTQQDLLGAKPLATREAMIEFLNVMEGRRAPLDPPPEAAEGGAKAAAPAPDPLVGVLRACREQKSMTPLYEYRAREAVPRPRDAPESDLSRTDRLLEVLKYPPKPAAK